MNSHIMRTAVAVLLVLAALPTSAPLAAEDQSKRKIPLVGYLTLGAAIPPSVFVSRLRDLGYIDKENVTIEYRFGEGRHDVMGALAGELVSLNVDVIMAVGDEAIAAAKKATTIIPIVMFACDALAVGFINSLSSPGGNITGVTCLTAELSPKRVALLKEIVPTASRVGLMFNPANAGKPKDAERTKAIAQGLGFKIQSEEVLEPADFERAFAAFEREHAQALIVLDETFTTLHAKRIAELALQYQLPTMHSFSESVVAGGLISYGPSGAQMVQIATTYVDKILKGAKPADLAVQQPTKFEMFVNLKTARALGVTIPNSILLRADKVIE